MRKRNDHVTFWLSEEEYRTYKKNLEKEGGGSGDYLRKLIAECHIEPHDPEKFKNLLEDVTIIGARVNQIAHAVNGREFATERELQELDKLVCRAHTLVVEALT